MMELTCAFILISASFVLATPHGYGGYGVKGGASAKAESSASAGAFGGIPVAVPQGAGYSGSFSKSSSSSSASSSASSSSSSSSFSYSGSGAGGFGLNGGAPGHGGCLSGNCPTAGGSGTPVPHGSSAYNSANAAASAAAGAVTGSGCQGLSCDDNNSEKCVSGQCKPKTGNPSIDSDSNKCTSGQCGSALENSASPTDNGSNDIRAVTESSHSGHNANNQHSNIDKTSYNGASSDCSHGKCGPSGPTSSKPSYYSHDSGNSYQGSSASNNQQASSVDVGLSAHYQKPSTHLETPKLGSKCYSGNCNAGPVEPGYESSPSSYNVPIHGTYDKSEPKPSCDGVRCENQPKGPYNPTDNSVTKEPSSSSYPSATNCKGSSCFGTPANQITSGPAHTVTPGNYGHSPSNEAPGHIGHGKPSDVEKSLDDKVPYTGGFGGPAGVLNPNEYGFPVPTSNPSHGHASTPQNGKPLGGAPTGCNSPSCSGTTGGVVPTGTYNHKPGGNNPSEKLPTYTGGFGGPAGMLKPNEFDVHATVTSKPNYGHPGSPSYNTQPPAGNIGTGCKAGVNCGGYSPTADATSGATASSGYYGTTKPINAINFPNDKLPTYIGGFGGPGGVFNPDKHDIHATGPSSPGFTPSGTQNTPSISSSHPGGCKTSNCYADLGTTAAANAHAESFGVTKPSSGPQLSSVTLPAYPISNDRPLGVHKPNEISGPASTPSFTHTQSPSSPGTYSPGCKTGSCANYPTSGPSAGANAQPGSYGKPTPDVNPAAPAHPQYTGGFGGPSGTFAPNDNGSPGCKTGNCGNYPTSGPSAAANAQPGSFGATKPAPDVNLAAPARPQYTGGFGGPSGTFAPNEHGSPGCKTGNCGNYPSSGPSAGANAQPGSYGVTKPTPDVNAAAPNHPHTGGFGGPTGTFAPNEHGSPGCKTGNCGNYPSSGPSAGANAQPGSYGVTKPTPDVNAAAPTHPHTGGFGGPTGTFAPNEHGSPGCKTGNCGNYPSSGPSAGANAQPGSYGVTKPTPDVNAAAPTHPHTGGFGGPSGTIAPNEHGSPGCKTGNCGNYPSSGPSAGANAQPGSYGVTKPTADVVPAAPAQPQYTGGFGGPSGTFAPNEHNSPGCKTGNCGNYPTSGPSSGANAQPGSFGATKPTPGVSPAAPTQPQYTGSYGGPSGPSGSPTTSADAVSGANAQPGSYGITKPSGGNKPSDEKPTYSGGFGGAPGLLKPNEYTIPAVSSTPNKKPAGVHTPAACTSGNCNLQVPALTHGSTPHSHNGASSVAHATAAAVAEANAVAYSGGFGGPPGVLAPYDDGKIGATSKGGEPHAPQIGGSHNANIHSQHGTIPTANGGPTGPHGNIGAQAGSNAGATAYAGAAAGASAGAHGYNPHGSHYNHAGNIKGGSPCSGGCGGSSGGAYNGGSTLEVDGGDGFPKLVSSDGLHGGGSTSAAAARSLAGANAFGVGGSYASSSASAHASAGAYTKGGYGKR